jgi:FkbM family methyltransferase
MFDLNVLKDKVAVRSDSFEGAEGWTWVSDPNDFTWDVITHDWTAHHRPKLQEWFPNGGSSVVMAGGNCGLYPALLSPLFRVVYTFEPEPTHFHCLTNNCQIGNIIKIQGALGTVPGFVGISETFQGNTGMTKVAETPRDAIPVFTVDQFEFQELDLLFLDTEGFEPKILTGSMVTLERCSPKILIELGDVDQGEYENFNHCTQLLNGVGYTEVERIGRLDYAISKPEKTLTFSSN